jgi:chromosome segregation ATPase
MKINYKSRDTEYLKKRLAVLNKRGDRLDQEIRDKQHSLYEIDNDCANIRREIENRSKDGNA